MNTPKTNLALHMLVQMFSQSTIIAIVPEEYKPYVMAFAAALGVLAAYFDNSSAKA